MIRPPAQDRLADRLLAEAVRAAERDGAALRNEPAADEAGRAAGGDLEHRIIRRAGALSVAGGLRDGLRQVQQSLAWMIAAILVIAATTGAGAVRAALGSGPAMSTPVEAAASSVNFFWVLISLLGVQTLLLTAWLAIMIFRPRAANVSPLGGAVMAAARWVAARGHREPDRLAALRAAGVVHGRGAIGRWSLSATSHAVWSAANTGGLVILILLLSTREYTFNWETTILSSEAYERMTRVIGVVPRAAGFPVPTLEQIRATEAGGGAGRDARDPAAARAWSGLLIGAIAVYGFGPRILLLGLCLSARRRACGRYRLDTRAPGYLKLRDRLMPSAESRGIVDGDEETSASSPVAAVAKPASPATSGPPVLVGLEIDRPTGPWPPRLHAVRWNDLGFVDAREDRKSVLAELSSLADPPVMTTIVCALSTTPDRGLGAFVESVTEATRGPVGVVLTGGQALRERAEADQVEQRVDDWRELAERAGVAAAHVVEADLDHLTDASRQRLSHLVGASGGEGGNADRARVPARRIEEAFSLIVTATRAWDGAPKPREQAALQKRIAELYRHETSGLIARLGLKAGAPDDVVASMKDGAKRFVSVLPDRLQRSPKWLAAGALSGAVGCIAIGALVAPAALAALPAWTMGGAGLGALLQFARGGGAESGDSGADSAIGDAPQLEDAVRAAALFALLLELQGRDEAEISRVLDRALPDEGDESAAILDADAAAAWLDELRHRYDLALAAEERS